jgi:hypothetical protein
LIAGVTLSPFGIERFLQSWEYSVARDKQVLQAILNLKNRIVPAPFGESQWKELGALTGMLDRVQRHPRLLRSLSFGDEDYDGHALSMLQEMVDADAENLEIISGYVEAKCPDTGGESISSQEVPGRRVYFTPSVFSVPDDEVDIKLVSVMMPFGAELSPVYDAIMAATTQTGMRCERADNIWEHSVVIQDIFTLIFRSFIVVCDFSGKNPNVFYEAGIAHTLGKHVIPITSSDDDIPFDLKHHRYLKYLNNKEGRKDLQAKLAERLRTLTKDQPRW